MRRILAAAATLGVASLGVLLPTTSAQAQDLNCQALWNTNELGNFLAYDFDSCFTPLGETPSWDSDWGNSSGPFQGGDTNDAQSLLHRGTSGMAVQLFNGTGQDWGGGYTCLKKSEMYMHDLNGFTFTSGAAVNENISSHRWTWGANCAKFLDS